MKGKITALTVTVLMAVLASVSSCTKEQQFLTDLHGTWTLDSYTLNDGSTPTPIIGVTTQTQVTFFDCSTKNTQQNCTVVTTNTTNTTINGSTTTTINSSTGFYEVEEKSTLIMYGTVWAVDKVDKKSLTIHKVDAPKAVYNYSK
ncbi:MAG TPA: hypothetical protein VG603_01795 [Chitinophagales bacterium]|nr:hypothetical protein [Chitinophagales bacterium]